MAKTQSNPYTYAMRVAHVFSLFLYHMAEFHFRAQKLSHQIGKVETIEMDSDGSRHKKIEISLSVYVSAA